MRFILEVINLFYWVIFGNSAEEQSYEKQAF